ncbi:MAG TPA: nucleoside-diphosphate sugar epimerase/dehydratase, partial [Bacteroidota bacterium]|nr:nucleoside-diphosphate sugar epimerase/dehydratase [Bacteroidota bacterium]
MDIPSVSSKHDFLAAIFGDRKRIAVMMSDLGIITLSYMAAFLIRFEMQLPAAAVSKMIATLPLILAVRFACFWYFGLYRGVWPFASIYDLCSIVKGVGVSSLLIVLLLFLEGRFSGYPRSVFFIDGLLLVVLIGGTRFSFRLRKEMQHLRGRGGKRVLIVGAGEAGESILREMMKNPSLGYHPVGLMDDDRRKWHSLIHNVEVLGGVDCIKELVNRYRAEEVIIAIPSVTGSQMRRLVTECKGCGVAYKTLPGIADIIDGTVGIKALRDVDFEDLLGRPPVKLNAVGIEGYLAGKRVLITGCGGSIGSQLVRQIARFGPRSLILYDASEENLFNIQMELEHEIQFHEYHTVLGRVQNHIILEQTFERYQPDVVFHAAAYKHVPMLEINPWEVVFNNILASRLLMDAALAYSVERFVLVSSDKAVRPTNVMGASKRVTELLLQSMWQDATRFMAVRFGNVVGSSGSVVPLFKRQIERGGPVTVTDAKVTRYFMSIPEAAQLILQAGSLGRGGEIFVLEMGTPVKIIDLARDLVRLMGKEPDSDIEIKFTGLRPGEKLYEELLTAGEEVVRTEHDRIMVLRANGMNGFRDRKELRLWLDRKIKELEDLAVQMNGD